MFAILLNTYLTMCQLLGVHNGHIAENDTVVINTSLKAAGLRVALLQTTVLLSLMWHLFKLVRVLNRSCRSYFWGRLSKGQ